jgi:hypothetical protein
LVLGIIDVLETVQQQVIHRFDVFRKQAHDALHLAWRMTHGCLRAVLMSGNVQGGIWVPEELE